MTHSNTETLPKKRQLKNLGSRLFFVFWAAPLALFIINAQVNLLPLIFGDNPLLANLKPLYPATILAILVTLGAAKEYINMLGYEYKKNGFNLAYLWLIPSLFSALLKEPLISFSSSLYLLLLLVAIEAFFVGKGTQRWKRASLFFSGIIFLFLAGSSLFHLFEAPFLDLWNFPVNTLYFGNLGLVTILCAIFCCDGAAYFTGSLIGKHHFSSISPKKTIEGSVGGLIASILVMTIAFAFFRSEGTPFWLGPVLGVVIGIFAQLGDLTVSLMKRYFNVKDTSNLIPGHGGILDRFDSLFFTAPIVHLIITLALKLY